MLALLLLSGCSLLPGPHEPLQQARQAMADRDLAALEQAVDLEGVGPGLVALCAAGLSQENWVSDQFTPERPLMNIAKVAGEAWLNALIEGSGVLVAEGIRENWSTFDPYESCPGVRFGEPSAWAVWDARDSQELAVPVWVHDTEGEVTLEVRETEAGWRIMGLDAQPAVEAQEAQLMERARAQAEARSKQLDSAHPQSWAELRAFLKRHPDEAKLAQAYEAAAAPLRASEVPIEVRAVDIELAGFLKMKRVVRPAVFNPSDAAISSYRLRVSFLDDQGKPVVSTTGEEALIVAVSTAVQAKASDSSGQVIARGIEWPTLAQAQAVPIEVIWTDGRSWTHPAVEAGMWSR